MPADGLNLPTHSFDLKVDECGWCKMECLVGLVRLDKGGVAYNVDSTSKTVTCPNCNEEVEVPLHLFAVLEENSWEE